MFVNWSLCVPSLFQLYYLQASLFSRPVMESWMSSDVITSFSKLEKTYTKKRISHKGQFILFMHVCSWLLTPCCRYFPTPSLLQTWLPRSYRRASSNCPRSVTRSSVLYQRYGKYPFTTYLASPVVKVDRFPYYNSPVKATLYKLFHAVRRGGWKRSLWLNADAKVRQNSRAKKQITYFGYIFNFTLSA